MTKSQSNKAFSTASNQNSTLAGNAQSSYDAAQGDVGDFKTALAKYSAENPYVQGGQFQTSADRQVADTAAAGGAATQQALTGAMVRSGLNPTAAIAAGKQVAQENARGQMDQEARLNEARLQGLAGYNQNVLGASAKPEEMEADLTKTEMGGADSTLNAETDASKTPSFWQELGQGAIQAGVGFAGKAKGCWIAARVFGGWEDPRTELVRLWLFREFAARWYGHLLVNAYYRHGEWVADRLMPRSKLATRFFTWLFKRALRSAEAWRGTVEGQRAIECAYLFGEVL